MKPKLSKPVKCRACGKDFIRARYKGTAKYCSDPKCQEEKTLRYRKKQKKEYIKIVKRTNRICSCCGIKKVPKRKVNGIYLTRLCENCFRRAESDVLAEHRILVGNS